MKHRTKEGREIDLKDMTLDHLLNTIAWIKRRAEEGVIVRCGGGVSKEDLWCDEDVFYDDEALEELNYHEYVKELSRRKDLV